MNRPYEPPPSPLGPGQKRSGNPFASRTGWAFFLALVVGGCALYYLEIHRGQEEQLDTMLDLTHQLEERLAGSREMADQLEVYRKTTERLQMLILKAEERIPHEREIPSLTAAIVQTAQNFSVTVLHFEPQPAMAGDTLTRIPIKLEMEGTRESLHAFFVKLASLDRRVNVTSLSLRMAGDTANPSRMKIGCRVEAFALGTAE